MGPRAGLNEININPKFEYITGVLEPKDFTFDDLLQTENLDNNLKHDGSNIYSIPQSDLDDNYDNDPFDLESKGFDSVLHPKSRPKSLGVSFMLKTRENPAIDFCITFSRYESIGKDPHGDDQWKRAPESFFQYNLDIRKNWDTENIETPRGIAVHLLSTKVKSDTWKVSLFVNATSLKDVRKYNQQDLIFQPQIRIVCCDGTSLAYLDEFEFDNSEDKELSCMYQSRRAYARGHMCSASWKDGRKSLEIEELFEWDDSQILPEYVGLHFKDPDIKSEYIPCYSIQQPPSIQSLNAHELSTLFDPMKLKKKLESISIEYEEWIKEQESLIGETCREISIDNIKKCKKCLNRIKSSIELLFNDEKVRLAFCFMNAAMDQQFKWDLLRKGKKSSSLMWYRFQIAYILQCVSGIVNPDHPDRNICDLLWYPTGGGKTEAYLALMIFTLSYRRISATQNNNMESDGGISVISRYTLRLLTIQQFRRSVKAILACDMLRVIGWKPEGYSSKIEHLWGKTRFSIGLWVGSEVTPNDLEDVTTPGEIYLGGIGSLRGKEYFKKDSFKKERREIKESSEPAQLLNCPCCDTILAFPASGGQDIQSAVDIHIINWIFRSDNPKRNFGEMSSERLGITAIENDISLDVMPNPKFWVIRIPFSYTGFLSLEKIDSWWKNIVSKALGVSDEDLRSARASRPGYFIKSGNETNPYDFEIHCPNLKCPLNSIDWYEEMPSDNNSKKFVQILEYFQKGNDKNRSFGMPISAFTVDSQIYRYCPSFLISTVDKFARLPYEPKSASIFGNVDQFDSLLGYFRKKIGPDSKYPKLGYRTGVKPFKPPSLIIQDELHLIDGPLGSITGLYELAIDALATTENGEKPKYIVSTATIRDANNQVQALYDRDFALFPPLGITIEDSFFNSFKESNVLEADPPGRLYVGICTPGMALIPIARIWSSLLKEVKMYYDRNEFPDSIDNFWTIVGYFNSLKELAIARGIYAGSQIRGRIGDDKSGTPIRELSEYGALELSGQLSSLNLPAILKRLEREKSFDVDALFTTSMFGTGIDISRLSLMIVHGQPKSTSSYIQATGRVGRDKGGLVITLLKSTRPRDLNHYEFFIGYHRALYRYVEPVSVYPFSSKATSRALGPIAVALLRNARIIGGIPVSEDWCPESKSGKKSKVDKTISGSRYMGDHRETSSEINKITDLVIKRSQNQPEFRTPSESEVDKNMTKQFDRWETFAKVFHHSLLYWEQTMSETPVHPAVLGSPHYEDQYAVFKNAPNSLREVESTAGFGDDVE